MAGRRKFHPKNGWHLYILFSVHLNGFSNIFYSKKLQSVTTRLIHLLSCVQTIQSEAEDPSLAFDWMACAHKITWINVVTLIWAPCCNKFSMLDNNFNNLMFESLPMTTGMAGGAKDWGKGAWTVPLATCHTNRRTVEWKGEGREAPENFRRETVHHARTDVDKRVPQKNPCEKKLG